MNRIIIGIILCSKYNKIVYNIGTFRTVGTVLDFFLFEIVIVRGRSTILSDVGSWFPLQYIYWITWNVAVPRIKLLNNRTNLDNYYVHTPTNIFKITFHDCTRNVFESNDRYAIYRKKYEYFIETWYFVIIITIMIIVYIGCLRITRVRTAEYKHVTLHTCSPHVSVAASYSVPCSYVALVINKNSLSKKVPNAPGGPRMIFLTTNFTPTFYSLFLDTTQTIFILTLNTPIRELQCSRRKTDET